MWPFKNKEQKINEAKAAVEAARRRVAELERELRDAARGYDVSLADLLKTNVGKTMTLRLEEAKKNLSVAEKLVKKLEKV